MLRHTILIFCLIHNLGNARSQGVSFCKGIDDTIRVCEGSNISIKIENKMSDSSTIRWTGPNFSSNDSLLLIRNISVNQAGQYMVMVMTPTIWGGFFGCGENHRILVTPKKANIITATVCPSHPYIFSNGSNNATPGTYYDTLHTAIGCDSIVTIQLKNFIAKDTLQAAVCPGESHRLPDGRLVNTPGIYSSTMQAQNGCDSLVYTNVKQVAGDIAATVPNTFTPNGDGLNDMFRIVNLPQQRFVSLQVYNRYSQAVFSTSNVTTVWNGIFKGKPQPAGSYVYLLQYINCRGKLQQSKGTIILMR
jgi:gliding motility-associated-like protein